MGLRCPSGMAQFRLFPFFPVVATLVLSAPVASGQPTGRGLVGASERNQLAFVRSALDRGLPNENGNGLSLLVQAHSALLVPMIEEKVEEVLNSPDPVRCFRS